MSLGRLRKPFAQGSQIGNFTGLELGKTSREISDCVVKPLFLIVRVTPDDTALHDVLEKLIASFLIRRIYYWVASWSKLWFCHFLWVVRLTDAPET